MSGAELDINSLPPVQAEELAHDLIELVARQQARIADLEKQLRNERRISGDVADAELWRQGSLR
jgi:hypothetical protein